MPQPKDPQSLLETSPFKGDLQEALAAHPPRAKLPFTTIGLTAAVVAVAGFVGGVQADQHWGPETPGQNTPATVTGPGPGQFPNGRQPGMAGFPGGPGGPGQRTGLTQATVTKSDKGTIELRTSDGHKITLKTGDRVTVLPSGMPAGPAQPPS